MIESTICSCFATNTFKLFSPLNNKRRGCTCNWLLKAESKLLWFFQLGQLIHYAYSFCMKDPFQAYAWFWNAFFQLLKPVLLYHFIAHPFSQLKNWKNDGEFPGTIPEQRNLMERSQSRYHSRRLYVRLVISCTALLRSDACLLIATTDVQRQVLQHISRPESSVWPDSTEIW